MSPSRLVGLAWQFAVVSMVLGCRTAPGTWKSPLVASAGLQAITFERANEWQNYFTIHRVSEALQYGDGRGVRVGILDGSFGVDDHPSLYNGSADFLNQPIQLTKQSWHGYWMATTLREIAPRCEVYALNVFSMNETTKVAAIAEAIDWSIEHHIDILSYSGPQFSAAARTVVDAAVDKALAAGIVTTFIHYDHPGNIKPDGFFPYGGGDSGSRPADVNIFPYDYNVLLMSVYSLYQPYQAMASYPQSGDEVPYFSISSTSVVTAGFVAILKSVDSRLSAEDCRQLLVSTSRAIDYDDPFFGKRLSPKHVVDIAKAVEALGTGTLH